MAEPEPMTDAELEVLRANFVGGNFMPAVASIVGRLLARLDQAEARGAWRTIESAPKDGTRVLVMGLYAAGTPGRWTSIATLNYRGWLDDNGAPFVFGITPDFWQPLPAPPRAGGEP